MGLSINDIKIKLGPEKNCVQSISVEWPAVKVKEKIEEAFKGVQGQARLPGFRPGKSPIELVRQNYSETAHARAQDELLREGVAEALKIKKIHAIEAPTIQSLKFDPDKSFQFEFSVEVAPQFKLAGYKGFKINKKPGAVTPEEEEKELNGLRESQAKLVESKAEKVGTEHFVVLNYEGFVDGKPIDGAKSENFLLDMSAPQTIAGLSEGLKGAKAGEDREIPVKFPKDSPSKNLQGKEATFKIKVVALKEKKAPTLDDEFAKDLGLGSLAELKEKIRGNLETGKKRGNRRELELQVIEKLLNGNKFQAPQSLIDNQTKHLIEKQKEKLSYQGVPKAEQVLALDRVKGELSLQAEKDVRLAFILNAIGEAEKVEVSEEEIHVRVEQIVAQSADNQKESVKKALKGAYLDKIRSEMKDTKLFDLIISYAKISEIKGG